MHDAFQIATALITFTLAPTTAPTISPDLRTAIATEALTAATIKFGILTILVAVLALIAAATAAMYAIRTVRLEDQPALSVTRSALPGQAASEQLYSIEVLPIEGRLQATIQPTQTSLHGVPSFYLNVRNLGRSPVVAVELSALCSIEEYIFMPTGPSPEQSLAPKFTGDGTIQIDSILPGASAYVPIVASYPKFRLEITEARMLMPDYGRKPRRRRHLRFATAPLYKQ